MVSFNRGCNRVEDKAACNERNLKNRTRLDVEDPLLFRATEVREVIQVLIAPAHDGRKRRSLILGEHLRFYSNPVRCPLAWKWVDVEVFRNSYFSELNQLYERLSKSCVRPFYVKKSCL